jgi:hypothetical protein
MIDLKLTEVFGVLGVGIFMVISLVYFFFLYQKLFNIRRHNKDAFISWLKLTLNGNYKDTGYAIVSGLLVYCAGLLTQDITDHMTDSETNTNPIISFVKTTPLLENEGELRKAVLIDKEKKLTGLGREVFGNAQKILAKDSVQELRFFNDSRKPADYWAQHGDSIYSLKRELTGFINGLYYTAKNWCYMKSPPVQKELDDIQERIDFSRSIAITAFLAIIGILLLYTWYYINEWLLKKKSSRFKVVAAIAKISPQSSSRKVERKVFYPYRALVILIIIMYVAAICYSAAEKNFNERAMGYYVSQLKYHTEEAKSKSTN